MKMIPKTRFVPYVYECLPRVSRTITIYTKGKLELERFDVIYRRSLDTVLRTSVAERLFRRVTDAVFLVPERPRRRGPKSGGAPPYRPIARAAKPPQNSGQAPRRTRVLIEHKV
jgi:hypothetical protein